MAKRHIPLTPEEREEIKRLYGRGYIYKEIARLSNINVGKVKYAIHKMIELGELKHRERATKDCTEQIVALYNEGLKMSLIAKKLGVSQSKVSVITRNLIDAGLLEKRTNDYTEQIIALYKDGVRIGDIARKLGTHQSRVSLLVRNLIDAGLLEKRTRQRCQISPGLACLNCPFDDCIKGDMTNMTDEESELMTNAHRVEKQVLISDEYTCKRRYLNGRGY